MKNVIYAVAIILSLVIQMRQFRYSLKNDIIASFTASNSKLSIDLNFAWYFFQVSIISE